MTKAHNYISFVVAAALSVYWQQAAIALFLGIALAVTLGPLPLASGSKLSRIALQVGVVVLGLALPFREVITLGSTNGALARRRRFLLCDCQWP